MSNRFGRNQRRRARAVEAELAATQHALGQAVTGPWMVGDPSRGFPHITRYGTVHSFSLGNSTERHRLMEQTADLTLYVAGNMLYELQDQPKVAWRGIIWIVDKIALGRSVMDRCGDYSGRDLLSCDELVTLRLKAIGARIAGIEDAAPMTATRWEEIKKEVWL